MIDELGLREMVKGLHPDQLYELIDDLPAETAEVLLDEFGALQGAIDLPATPLEQAHLLMDGFVSRPHLEYLSERIAKAVTDVENGIERRIIVQMPPRSGKSLLTSQVTPGWILAAHPSWDMLLVSYSRSLATSWGRQIRRWVSSGDLGSHLRIAPDSGAVENWETTEGGKVAARSIGSDLTGFGGKVIIIDDPHKSFAEANSKENRDRIWNWFLSDLMTRRNRPALTIIVLTRWHEDDIAGRLLSTEYEGDPSDWEVISFPAIAEKADVLGRAEGDPLYTHLVEETREEAIESWAAVRRDVGSYTWSALYQQRPSPPKGAIFSTEWWRYWTTDPEQASRTESGELDPNGKVVLLPVDRLASGQWLDSWDAAFKGTESSDYVVGQRWVRIAADRYLIAQQRGRKSFTETIAAMEAWAKTDDPEVSPYGHFVNVRYIEDKANGPAIIDQLRRKVSGIKAVNPQGSKEARARAATPEIESGNVLLPHPSMPGYEWVTDFVSEFREFPTGANDDQVDAASQALLKLQAPKGGGISTPGGSISRPVSPSMRARIPSGLSRR